MSGGSDLTDRARLPTIQAMSAAEPEAIDAPNGASTTRLILIRHGESNVTVRRVIGGFRTCDGLSPLGSEQAHRLAARLTDTPRSTPTW